MGMTMKSFQNLRKPKDTSKAFKKLIRESPTAKQIAFIKALCEALRIDYMRPGTLQSASKQIDRLKKRLKKRASINSNLFCDNITERLEALAYDDGDYAYVDGYNPFYGEY